MALSNKDKKYGKKLESLGIAEIAEFYFNGKYILLDTKKSNGIAKRLYEEFKEKHKDNFQDYPKFIDFLKEKNVQCKIINYDYFLFKNDFQIRNSDFALLLE